MDPDRSGTHEKVSLKLNTKSPILLRFFGLLSCLCIFLLKELMCFDLHWSRSASVFSADCPQATGATLTCEIKELAVPVVYVPP